MSSVVSSGFRAKTNPFGALAVRLRVLVVAVVLAGTGLPKLEPTALAAGLDEKGRAVLKQATRFYKQGMYDEAAKLLTDLVVDHPEMASLQRNLGACYYYMRRPEPALSNLRDYLARKENDIAAEDKQEVERWMGEMEKLRAENAAAARVPPAAEPAAQPTPAPVAPASAVPGQGPSPAAVSAPAPAPLAPTTGWPGPAPATFLAPGQSGQPGLDGSPAAGQPYYASPPPTAGAPAAAPLPPATPGPARSEGQGEETARDVDTPAFRRGFLAMPYVGWQFPIHAMPWISSAFRVGILLGGHVSENISLSGEVGFAMWSYFYRSLSESYGEFHEGTNPVQLDFTATMLGHIGWSRAELVVGPKLGWSVIVRDTPNYGTDSGVYVNGPNVGVRTGLLVGLSGSVAVGVVVDLTYIRSVSTPRSEWCQGGSPPPCADSGNTVLGSLAGALLF